MKPVADVRWQEVALRMLPRHNNGVDWGCPRKVVLQDGAKRVLWLPGFTTWIDRRTYIGGSLRGFEQGAVAVQVAEGGRLASHLKDPAVLKRIAEFFGVSESDLPVFKQGKSYIRRKS